MKRTLCVISAIAGLLYANTTYGQDNILLLNKKAASDCSKRDLRKSRFFAVGTDGIEFGYVDSTQKAEDRLKKEKRKFTMSYTMLDLGATVMMDNTNYSDPAVKGLLNVPANRQNKSLFDMRTAKSVNVNIYPWLIKYKALKTKNQRIYISTGIGLQLYNFRYEDPIKFSRNPVSVALDTISFKKNKLAIDYLNVPLMFTFKTKIGKDEWLVYGAGVTEGFRIDSWTKQESGQRGKVKVHDQFGLNDFNTCISAEIGLEGIVRLFATYQVTSLFQNGLDQHPVTIGFRFGGI